MLLQLISLVLAFNTARFPKIFTFGACSAHTWVSRSVVYGVPRVLPEIRSLTLRGGERGE